MRKLTTRVETREVQEVESIACNKCGQDIDRDTRLYGNYFVGEYCGGYASILGDCDRWNFDLCEPCLKTFMSGFVIRPEVNNEQ